MAELVRKSAVAPTWTALVCRLSEGSEYVVWHVSETRLGERTAACGALLMAMDWIVGPKLYDELPADATLCRPCAMAFGRWVVAHV